MRHGDGKELIILFEPENIKEFFQMNSFISCSIYLSVFKINNLYQRLTKILCHNLITLARINPKPFNDKECYLHTTASILQHRVVVTRELPILQTYYSHFSVFAFSKKYKRFVLLNLQLFKYQWLVI